MSPKIDTSKENDNDLILSSTAKGASYLILLQLLSRMLTFFLHQIVLRYTTAETFGIASVKLELLLSTILFISREGYRCALVRGDDSATKGKIADQKSTEEQKITNISYIPTVIGLLTTCLACGYYLSTIDDYTASLYPYYRTSIVLFGAAAWIELCIEPLFILALNRMYFQLRVSVEGVAVVLRCLITFLLTLWGATLQGQHQLGKENAFGVLAFAVAQFAFGLTMAFGYAGYFLLKVKQGELTFSSLFPKRQTLADGRSFWFDPELTSLGMTLTKQSLLKHVLTEGDKMLISALSTDADQGVYAFVVNYGSLVVRILFQPLEETGRTLFSKLLNRSEQTDDSRRMAIDILMVIIRSHVLLGLVFVCFATNYTSTLIDLLVGKKWSGSDAPLVLSFYCIYVPIMGINGITEGFVQAVGSKSDLARLSYYMVGFSLCFMGAGVLFMHFLHLGAIGLVLANMVNLGIRITYSWYYINRYFHQEKLKITAWFPTRATIAGFVISWMITRWSEHWIGWHTLSQKLVHIGIGGICFCIVTCLVLWNEKEFIHHIRQFTKAKKS